MEKNFLYEEVNNRLSRLGGSKIPPLPVATAIGTGEGGAIEVMGGGEKKKRCVIM